MRRGSLIIDDAPLSAKDSDESDDEPHSRPVALVARSSGVCRTDLPWLRPAPAKLTLPDVLAGSSIFDGRTAAGLLAW